MEHVTQIEIIYALSALLVLLFTLVILLQEYNHKNLDKWLTEKDDPEELTEKDDSSKEDEKRPGPDLDDDTSYHEEGSDYNNIF